MKTVFPAVAEAQLSGVSSRAPWADAAKAQMRATRAIERGVGDAWHGKDQNAPKDGKTIQTLISRAGLAQFGNAKCGDGEFKRSHKGVLASSNIPPH